MLTAVLNTVCKFVLGKHSHQNVEVVSHQVEPGAGFRTTAMKPMIPANCFLWNNDDVIIMPSFMDWKKDLHSLHILNSSNVSVPEGAF